MDFPCLSLSFLVSPGTLGQVQGGAYWLRILEP